MRKEKQPCEQLGLSQMTCEEATVFAESAIENGTQKTDVLEDMRMIDAMLQMTKLHRVVHVHIKQTSRGFTRKGVGFYDALEGILNARTEGAFNY